MASTSSLHNATPTLFNTDPCLKRYWKHYKQVWSWYNKHIALSQQMASQCYQEACKEWYKSYNSSYGNKYNDWSLFYTNSLKEASTAYWQYYGVNHPPPLPKDLPSEQSKNLSSYRKLKLLKKKRKRRAKLARSRKKRAELLELNNVSDVSDSQSDIDDSLEEVEISEDMMKFFMHSAKHRKERDGAPDDMGIHITAVDYVNLVEVSEPKNKASILPPKERPGVRRTTEMHTLYGSGAAMIHGMETAMQLSYDRHFDVNQPKLWPQLPLNITFN